MMQRISVEQGSPFYAEATRADVIRSRFRYRKAKTRCVLICGCVTMIAMAGAGLVAFVLSAEGPGSDNSFSSHTAALTSTCPGSGDIVNVCNASTSTSSSFYIDTFSASDGITNCKCGLTYLGSASIKFLGFSAKDKKCKSQIQLSDKTYSCPTDADSFTHTLNNTSKEELMTLTFTKDSDTKASYCIEITPNNLWKIECRIEEQTTRTVTPTQSTTVVGPTTADTTILYSTTVPTTLTTIASPTTAEVTTTQAGNTTTEPATTQSATADTTTVDSTTVPTTITRTTVPTTAEVTTTQAGHTTTEPATTQSTAADTTTGDSTTVPTTITTTTVPTTAEVTTTSSVATTISNTETTIPTSTAPTTATALQSACPEGTNPFNICGAAGSRNKEFYIDTFSASDTSTSCICDLRAWIPATFEFLGFTSSEATCSSQIQIPDAGKTYDCSSGGESFTHTPTNVDTGLMKMRFTKNANTKASYCFKIIPSDYWTVDCKPG